MIKTSQIGVMFFVIKNARRSGLSLVVLLMVFSMQEAPDFMGLAAERIGIPKAHFTPLAIQDTRSAQSYPLPDSRVKPGFGVSRVSDGGGWKSTPVDMHDVD